MGIKAKKKFNKRARRNELDKLWSLKVRERDFFVCQQCLWEVETGKKPPQDSPMPDKKNHAHHIISKAVGGYACRWDIQNGICLCYKHHIIKLPQDPIEFVKFIEYWFDKNGMIYHQMKYMYNETYAKFDEDYFKLKKGSLQ